jgi:hypothetical protein
MPLIHDIPFFANPLTDQPLDGYIVGYTDKSRLTKDFERNIARGWVQNGGVVLNGGYYSVFDKNHLRLMDFENFGDPKFAENLQELKTLKSIIDSAANDSSLNRNLLTQNVHVEEYKGTIKSTDESGHYINAVFESIVIMNNELKGNEELPHFRFTKDDDEPTSYYPPERQYFNFDALREFPEKTLVGETTYTFIGEMVDTFKKNYQFQFRSIPLSDHPNSISTLNWNEQNKSIYLSNIHLKPYGSSPSEGIVDIRITNLGDSTLTLKPPLGSSGGFYRITPIAISPTYYRVTGETRFYAIGTGVVTQRTFDVPLKDAWKGTNPLNIKVLPKFSTTQLFYVESGCVYWMGRDYSEFLPKAV